ncbi:hypothetical protein A4A49_63193, partial [Nicotiana attenuata]
LKDSYIKQDYLIQTNNFFFCLQHIPKRLYELILEAHSTAILQYGGKELFMGLNIGERRWLKDGWNFFLMKNDIKRGCFIKFELVEIAQLFVVFKVQVKGQGNHEDPVEI